MKKFFLIIVFVVLAVMVGNFAFKSLYDKENAAYVDEVLYKDPVIKEQYGDIKKYNVYKAGKSLGGTSGTEYYDFRIGVEGSKKSGKIYLKLYKTKDGQLDHYEVQ
ncbi:hypothetical protein [Acinetobacter colistiniresistens]|nr:hypothetical protein [Acinetobacter colistiniresistens]TVT79719.1 hypothetical protein FPV60_14115 [Acinetobacter colistiniresistens]